MSYGFNWSPYFDHQADHNARNQSSDVREGFQRHSYQSNTTSTVSNPSSNAHPPAHNPSGRAPSSHPSSYTPIGTTSSTSQTAKTGSQGHFDTRRLPPYSNAQSSADTTAMGSLAYASSLAQEQRTMTPPARYGPMQHIVDYNRYSQPVSTSADSNVYGMTSTASNGYEPYHSDSRGAGIPREQYVPPNPQSNFSTSGANATPNNEGYTRSYGRPSSRNSSETLTSRFALAPQQTEPSLATHPTQSTGDQSNRTAHSRPTSKPSQRTDHRPSQFSNQNDSTMHRADDRRQPFQAVKEPRHAETITRPTQATPIENIHAVESRSEHAERSTHSHPRNPRPNQQSEGQPRQGLSRAVDVPTGNHNADESRWSEAPRQTTVDPSQIFNLYEYQRRQATTEAARKAMEEAAAKKADASVPISVATPTPASVPSPLPMNTSVVASAAAPVPAPVPASVLSPVVPSATLLASAETDSAASRKGQMELEMMQMIEKMRDYKAKDPALFSQIWEQVKKVRSLFHLYL